MKQWSVKAPDEKLLARLIQETGLNPFICRILAGRNILSRNDAENFFNSEELSDPFLLADMEKAVEAINSAVEQGEKITVYGDYDCDGVTSAYILFSYLEALGAEVDWYIPSREEGYGLNREALGQIAARGDLPVLNGKVAPEGGCAGAVDEQAAGNEKVKQNCHLKSVSKSCYFLIFYNIFRKKARGARLPRSAWSAQHPFLHKTPRAPSVRGAL